MRIVALIILLAGCRAAEPGKFPKREPEFPERELTVREWLDNSDAGREVLESKEPLRFSDWE
jgi:hypothetical protein